MNEKPQDGITRPLDKIVIGKIYHTPYEPSGLFKVLDLEEGNDPTAFGVFIGDHPHGYKSGTYGRYYTKELIGKEVR